MLLEPGQETTLAEAEALELVLESETVDVEKVLVEAGELEVETDVDEETTDEETADDEEDEDPLAASLAPQMDGELTAPPSVFFK